MLSSDGSGRGMDHSLGIRHVRSFFVHLSDSLDLLVPTGEDPSFDLLGGGL